MKQLIFLLALGGCASTNPMSANKKACVAAYATMDFGLVFSYLMVNHKIMDDDQPKSSLYENTMTTVLATSGASALLTAAVIRNYTPEDYQCR